MLLVCVTPFVLAEDDTSNRILQWCTYDYDYFPDFPVEMRSSTVSSSGTSAIQLSLKEEYQTSICVVSIALPFQTATSYTVKGNNTITIPSISCGVMHEIHLFLTDAEGGQSEFAGRFTCTIIDADYTLVDISATETGRTSLLRTIKK